jgi:hypothetical protein
LPARLASTLSAHALSRSGRSGRSGRSRNGAGAVQVQGVERATEMPRISSGQAPLTAQ